MFFHPATIDTDPTLDPCVPTTGAFVKTVFSDFAPPTGFFHGLDSTTRFRNIEADRNLKGLLFRFPCRIFNIFNHAQL